VNGLLLPTLSALCRKVLSSNAFIKSISLAAS